MSESEDSCTLKNCHLAKQLMCNIKNVFQSKMFFDVSLKSKDSCIPAHKLILAASSKYFRVLFTSDLRCGDGDVDMTSFETSALESVVNYFYTGEITLSERNIIGVMEVEDMLGVGSLRPLLAQFIRSLLDKADCWAIWSQCRTFNYHDIADEAFLKIRMNFHALIAQESFLDVPYSLLKECLDSPHLSVPIEDIMLMRLCTWVAYDIEGRKHNLPEILEKIEPTRLKTITGTVNTVLKLFSTCGYVDLIKDKLDKFIQINKTEMPREHSRYYELILNVVFVIGGECGRVLKTVECLPSLTYPWRPTLPTHEGTGYLKSVEPSGSISRTIAPLLEPRYGAASCTSIDHIYIIGGAKGVDETEELRTVERYCPVVNAWVELAPLPQPKLYAAAAFSNNIIYISGGLSNDHFTNQLLMLVVNSRTWKQLAPMLQARCEHNLVSVDGVLYAFGGFDEHYHPLKSVEKYDPTTDTWIEVTAMQCARARAGAVVSDSYIYVLGGTGYIRESEEYSQEINYERFNTNNDRWEWCGSCPNSGWGRVRSVCVGKNIVSSTGSVGVSVYNMVAERSFPGPSLLEVRRDHALAALRLPVHTRSPI